MPNAGTDRTLPVSAAHVVVHRASLLRVANLIAAALLALSATLAGPVAAQQAGSQVPRVEFRDASFQSPGPVWRLMISGVEPGQLPIGLQFVRVQEGHVLSMFVESVEVPITLRALTRQELAARFFDGQRKLTREAGKWEFSADAERRTAGGRHPAMSYRVTVPGVQPVVEGTFLLYFPADLAERGRFYVLVWQDSHSASVAKTGLEEFDALVASFTLRPLGAALLADDFEDQEIGVLQKSSPLDWYERGYVDGQYVLRTLDEQEHIISAETREVFADTSLAVDVSLVGEPAGQTVYLYCRRHREASGYRLAIDPAEGKFRMHLLRSDDQPPVTLVDWQPSAAISGGNATNRLELTCAGSIISAQINGLHVASVEDDTYAVGSASIAVSSAGGVNADARFDNLVVTQR